MTIYVREVRKKGRTQVWWEYDIRSQHPSGETIAERRKSPVTGEAATKKWAEKRLSAILAAGPQSAQTKNARRTATVEEFSKRWIRDYCVANRHKPSGIEHKQLMLSAHIVKHLGQKRLDEISPQDVQDIKTRMIDRSPKTVNNALVVLSKMLRVAIEWGEIKEMPTIRLLRVERKSKPFLSVETYNKLIAGAAQVSSQCLALILLAGDAGLRRGEIFALQWADIDTERRVMVVQRSTVRGHTGSTKGNAVRYVPMTSDLIDALGDLPRKGRVLVLPGLDPDKTRELVRAAEKAAQLPETGKLHILRHTFASHIAMAGESLYHLQAALGHQDHATTQGYAHLAPGTLNRLTDGIDRMRGREPKKIGRHTGDNSDAG